MKYLQYVGILLGALYGLLYRMLCEVDNVDSFFEFNIYSISFVWVLPIVIGIIPILIARKEIAESKWKRFFYPVFSVLLFFLCALSSGLEDWLCILIIAFPFIAAAGLVGVLATIFLVKRDAKRNSNKMYSILILPFLLNPLETYLPHEKESFALQSTIQIAATQEHVWSNLIEVPEIKEDEYSYSFYNYLGVPRPVKSQLETINGREYRIGYFTDRLKLYESISRIDSLQFVEFDIHLDQSELRDLPTDKHLLNSDYFAFENISYQLEKVDENKAELTLHCSYTLNSKMNGYANFWAKKIIQDFEERLLESLKLKIEKQKPIKSK